MAEVKTKVTNESVSEFINSITDEQKRSDSFALLKMYSEATSQEAKMWGSGIIGFDKYHLKSKNSSQENDWPLAAFAPRKQTLTLYVIDPRIDLSDLLSKLGKHTTSKACLYINKLADVDLKVLEQIVKKSYQESKALLT